MAEKSEEVHVCEYCQKIFVKQSRLIMHQRSHTDERPFVCEVPGCDKQFKRVDHLRRHERMTHMSCTEQFRCEMDKCEAVFRSQQSLKKHIRRSHARDAYKCNLPGCGEVFRKHHQLALHRQDHSLTTAYVCVEPGCGKSFQYPTKLKRHEKTHKGYPCKEEGCTSVFSKWSLLVSHQRTSHSPDHVCPVCNKSFRQKTWLKQHRLTHEGDRAVYSCTYENCEREYLDQRNLNAHIRSYHDKKRFPCEHDGCGQTFATKQKQTQHMRLHDPTRPPPKKKPKKRKSLAEKLTGVSMETEARGQDSDSILKSPVNEDSVDLSDFPDIEVTPERNTSVADESVGVATENVGGVKKLVTYFKNSGEPLRDLESHTELDACLKTSSEQEVVFKAICESDTGFKTSSELGTGCRPSCEPAAGFRTSGEIRSAILSLKDISVDPLVSESETSTTEESSMDCGID